jgi:hypothetical protein
MQTSRVDAPLGRVDESNRMEGFWGPSNQPEPRDMAWDGRDAFLVALGVLENHAERACYRGWSNCRVCGCMNGSDTFHAKGWQWPSGFVHYVRDHNVKPSADFIAMVTEFFPAEA